MLESFDNYLFRCSGLGHLTTCTVKITEKQAKTIEEYSAKKEAGKIAPGQLKTLTELIQKRDAPDELPQGAKTYLDDIFRDVIWGRARLDFDNKYTSKGNLCEQDSMALMSSVYGTFYTSYKEHVSNEFIKGTPDIVNNHKVYDIKSKWDLKTFEEAKLDYGYEWQLKGYCMLLGLEKGVLVPTLVNSPYHLLEKEIKNLFFAMGCPDEDNEEYLEKARQIERNLIYDKAQFLKENPFYDFLNGDWIYDMPGRIRIKTFEVEATEKDFELIRSRVMLAREYLNEKLEAVKSKL